MRRLRGALRNAVARLYAIVEVQTGELSMSVAVGDWNSAVTEILIAATSSANTLRGSTDSCSSTNSGRGADNGDKCLSFDAFRHVLEDSFKCQSILS